MIPDEPENVRLVIDKSIKPIDLEKEEANLKKYQIDLELHLKKAEQFQLKIKETKERIKLAQKSKKK